MSVGTTKSVSNRKDILRDTLRDDALPARGRSRCRCSRVYDLLHSFFLDPTQLVLSYVMFIGMVYLALSSFVIYKGTYTEIDWETYMEQVEVFKSGEFDYYNIKGGTGPCVYPAGFLYLYSLLHSICYATRIHVSDFGNNWFDTTLHYVHDLFSPDSIGDLQRQDTLNHLYEGGEHVGGARKTIQALGDRTAISGAQCFYCSLLVANFLVVSYVSIRYLQVPKCFFFFIFFSKRLYSLALLRLFNDIPTITFAHLSMLLFAREKITTACIFYSIGVSFKMNLFLMAPGIAWFLFRRFRKGRDSPDWQKIVWHYFLMASVQFIIGAPFLMTNAKAYVHKSFELGRVFLYKWTVNWRFIPESIFVSKPWAIFLLCATIGIWLYFLYVHDRAVREDVIESNLYTLEQSQKSNKKNEIRLSEVSNTTISTQASSVLSRDVSAESSADGGRESRIMSDDGIPNPDFQRERDIRNRDLSLKVDQIAVIPPGFRCAEAMLMCNFIGIVFSRTIHYQFYSWYVFSLPYIVAASVAFISPMCLCKNVDGKEETETSSKLGSTDSSNSTEKSSERKYVNLLEFQDSFNKRCNFAMFVNYAGSFVLLLLVELCYNWPKARDCGMNSTLARCENPATPTSSLVLLFVHLFMLIGRVFLGKESYSPIFDKMVRTIAPRSLLLDMGKLKED